MLENLKPTKVWKYFEEICAIPHGSYNEKAISDYCVKFAKDRNLEVYQDAANNVIIIKEASKGYEDKAPVILQGHLDMVCEKAPGSSHDFEKDGLELMIEGDFVTAKDTTLGADDGIAIAFSLAILDDDTISHPRLEVMFTTSEEVGMDGAFAIDPSMLKGNTLINLDSDEEGFFTVGCAGGCTLDITRMYEKEISEGTLAHIKVTGLKGGHSGMEINKGLANANLLMARILLNLKDYELIQITGGTKDNAICRESLATLFIKDEKALMDTINTLNAQFKKELEITDPDVEILCKVEDTQKALVFSEEDTMNILQLLMSLPNGVQAMSQNTPGLVETSCNFGVFECKEDFKVVTSIRSELTSAKRALRDKITFIAENLGYEVHCRGDYPAWEYRSDSPLRDKMLSIYQEMFNETPIITTIHAGLECGLLSEKIKGMDCVSIGPQMYDIHTYAERISISSTERMFNFVLEILKR